MRTPDQIGRASPQALPRAQRRVTRVLERQPEFGEDGGSPSPLNGLTPVVPLVGRSRFDDLVSSLDAIVWEADGDDYKMTFVSPRAMDIAGYPPDRWLNEPEFWERHLHPDDRARAMSVTDAAIKALNSIRIEYRFLVASGEYRWFSDSIRVIRKADGSGHRLVGVMIDITDQKRIEQSLAYRATHDTLTGLLNREQLDIELARIHQLGEPWALLFLDLDGFKDVNDALGHSVGDEVLRIVAQRLSAAVRPDDILARFGGDEFCLLASVAEVETAVAIAQRLREAIHVPTGVGGHSLRLTVTVGIALAAAVSSPETLLQRADTAMYSAKSLESGVAVYESWMRKAALLRLTDAAEDGRLT